MKTMIFILRAVVAGYLIPIERQIQKVHLSLMQTMRLYLLHHERDQLLMIQTTLTYGKWCPLTFNCTNREKSETEDESEIKFSFLTHGK